MLDEVMAAVTRLPVREAAAVVMRFIQDEPYESIAAVLGCGPATARKHVARGRARLARSLRRLDITRLVHERDP